MEDGKNQPDEELPIAVLQPAPEPRFKRVIAVLLTFLLGPWVVGYFFFPTGWIMLTVPWLLPIFLVGTIFLLLSAVLTSDMSRRDGVFITGLLLLNAHFWSLVIVMRWTWGYEVHWDQAIFASFFFELTCIYQLGRIWYRRKKDRILNAREI